MPRGEEILRVRDDARVRFHTEDGLDFLRRLHGLTFDMIFADAWPGKYEGCGLALELLAAGGMYLIDDMLPQPNWPEDHAPNVERLLHDLGSRSDLYLATVNWSTGIALATKHGDAGRK